MSSLLRDMSLLCMFLWPELATQACLYSSGVATVLPSGRSMTVVKTATTENQKVGEKYVS